MMDGDDRNFSEYEQQERRGAHSYRGDRNFVEHNKTREDEQERRGAPRGPPPDHYHHHQQQQQQDHRYSGQSRAPYQQQHQQQYQQQYQYHNGSREREPPHHRQQQQQYNNAGRSERPPAPPPSYHQQQSGKPRPPPSHQQQQRNGNPFIGPDFLFDLNNQNATQSQVDEFFRKKTKLSSFEIVSIFLRAVQWKKKKRIDVLGGDKLSYLSQSLLPLISKMDGRQLTQASMATVNGLQATSATNIHTSGRWW